MSRLRLTMLAGLGTLAVAGAGCSYDGIERYGFKPNPDRRLPLVTPAMSSPTFSVGVEGRGLAVGREHRHEWWIRTDSTQPGALASGQLPGSHMRGGVGITGQGLGVGEGASIRQTGYPGPHRGVIVGQESYAYPESGDLDEPNVTVGVTRHQQ